MKRYFIVLIILSLQACGGPRVKVIPLSYQDIFESEYISFHAPKTGWETLSAIEWTSINGGKTLEASLLQYLLPSGTLMIAVRSAPHIYREHSVYFNKNADIDFEVKQEAIRNLPDNIASDKEQGVNYRRSQTTYVQGLKCNNTVYSRSYGGSLYDASSKDYRLSCGYYHKTEGRRGLDIVYRYYGASNSDGTATPVLNDAERELKQGLKEVLENLVLKDADWARMRKEGLLHDKPYQTIKW